MTAGHVELAVQPPSLCLLSISDGEVPPVLGDVRLPVAVALLEVLGHWGVGPRFTIAAVQLAERIVQRGLGLRQSSLQRADVPGWDAALAALRVPALRGVGDTGAADGQDPVAFAFLLSAGCLG